MKKIVLILITLCITSACGDDFTKLAPILDRNEGATTLGAKVLLTTRQDSVAEIVLHRIFNKYNYELSPNYVDLCGAVNENNNESIFDLQFISRGIGQGSAFANNFIPSSDLLAGQGFGRKGPTASLENAYEVGDLRFEPSMETKWINIDAEVIVQNYVRKYESNLPNENDSGVNFIVFRYADVLLILAEGLGESTESYGLINQVQTRAELGSIYRATTGSFERKLIYERRVELAFENHRWPDLKRFGVVAEKLIEAEPDVIEASEI